MKFFSFRTIGLGYSYCIIAYNQKIALRSYLI